MHMSPGEDRGIPRGDEAGKTAAAPGTIADPRKLAEEAALEAGVNRGAVDRTGGKFKMILRSIPWDIFSWGVTREVLATFAAHGNSICVGFGQGYSAVLLPQISDPGSTLHLTSQEASWVASLGVISNPLGALAAGIVSELLGRRSAVKLAAGPYIAGWLIIFLADDFLKLCIGRFICGMAVGMASASYVYVAEVSGAQHRGTLCASGPVFVSLGVLMVYAAGAFLNWTTVAAMACAASIAAYAFAAAILPETPAWLVSRGRLHEARESLEWLRGNSASAGEIDKDLAALMEASNTVSEAKRQETSTPDDQPRCCSFFASMWSLFARPQVWKPFVLLLFFFAFQEASGIYVLLYYAVDLFRSLEASHAPPAAPMNMMARDRISTDGEYGDIPVASALIGSLGASNYTDYTDNVLQNIEDNSSSGVAEGFLASIAVAGVRLLASIGGAVLMKKFGRRQLAMASGMGMAASMAVAGGYEFVFAGKTVADGRLAPWVPLACVLTHVCVSMIGFLQLPWIMTSELFPQAARGIAGGSVSALAHLLIFTSVKTYPDLEAWAGVPWTLWLFAGSAAAGAIFVYMFLPETKGKTLAEIEDEFSGGIGRRGCLGSSDSSECLNYGPICERKMKGTLNAVIVKSKHGQIENTQQKSLAAIMRQYCNNSDNTSDRNFCSLPTENHHTSNPGFLINGKLVEAVPTSSHSLKDTFDNKITQGSTLSQMQTKKQKYSWLNWMSLFRNRKEVYVAGDSAQEVTAISVISVDVQTNKF
ncbi:facilitated trehalose transporter Tret1-like [Ischnura elegans]|uniref:facilitated trehalose transporter Tret1-like n=1 Tax=Ischnura elegans TaxID=197161 RepID=UPI001ED88609|nr:facilitated trehalose transporter Tret1-like [Ischnura elegans]